MNDLHALLSDPSFTPGKKHLPALFEAATGDDEKIARAARRALVGVQIDLAPAIERRLADASPATMAVLVEIAARASTRTPRLDAIAIEGLSHASSVVRRAAASALGKGSMDAVAPLRAAIERETDDGARARMVEALGKLGGASALDVLERAAHEDGHRGARAIDRARLVAKRDASRDEMSGLDETAALDGVELVYRCRAGLERVLEEEIRSLATARLLDVDRPRLLGVGEVAVTFRGRLADVLRPRTALSVALPAGPVGGPDVASIVDALVRPPAADWVARLSRGRPRFRLELPRGKRRALVWDVAAALDARGAPLVNDPRSSAWTASVRLTGDEARLEWIPHVDDTRFAYRQADVAASSHPTLAAALARLTDPSADDVVWDPFVGAGGELCERSLLGPSRALLGTDVDDAALDRARANLLAVGATADLYRASATSFVPDAPVNVIVSNPPMGRRVLSDRDVAGLLSRFVARVPSVLARGGRLVWLSPAPSTTREAALREGLRLTLHADVDMGGFFAELQRFEKV